MLLSEAKQILEDNGYEISKADMNWRRSQRHIDRNDEIITVDHIGKDNYKDYIGKTVNVEGDVYLLGLGLKKLPIKFNKVDGFFNCAGTELTSLEGCPNSVGKGFDCSYNRLTSLEGCPKSVGKRFDCSYNKLTTLEGCPVTVGGDFYCNYNEVEFTEEEVKELCDVKGDIEV